ncbi:MAG: thermonuclease family protein [Rhodoferax sp.]|nr:thermonuclease family protein [Rhodoferax sp.]
MNRWLAIALIAICQHDAWARSTFHHEGAFAAQVTYITDGDTLWVRPLAGGAPFKVRLEGLDAPEICQAWGAQSRDALTARLAHRSVDVAIHRYDDYGRAVARIELAGEDVAAWMVREGHAWSYRYRRSAGPYAAEEAQARRARRGLFADMALEYPRDFRQRHGSCKF